VMNSLNWSNGIRCPVTGDRVAEYRIGEDRSGGAERFSNLSTVGGLKASAAPLLPEGCEALPPVKPSHVAGINDVVCKCCSAPSHLFAIVRQSRADVRFAPKADKPRRLGRSRFVARRGLMHRGEQRLFDHLVGACERHPGKRSRRTGCG
jgi:hypothetical protein